MNYLHDLINVLKDSELEQMRGLELPQRQRNVLDTMLGFRHRELPENSEIVKALDISLPHFYKVNSVLLDKCYEVFAPQRGQELLRFLAVKDLFRHFRHEMLQQEKSLVQTPPDHLAEFYRLCFELLQSQSVKNFKEEAVRECGEKFLRARQDKTRGDELYVEARLLRSEIISIGARSENVAERERIFKKLSALRDGFQNIEHPLAHFWHEHAWAQYYAALHEGDDFAEHMLEHLLKAQKICDEFPALFTNGECGFTRSKIGEAYYGESDFQKAYKAYDELFKSGDIEKQKRFYHTTKFVQVCIILGGFLKAEELLEENFGVYIASRQQAMTTMGALSYAKLYLAWGELLKAKEFIDLGFELNTKSQYIQYEIELRNLQNTYFFLKEDWETAEDFARRNLKFLTSKGFTLETSSYGFFYKMVLAFINMRLHKAKFPDALEGRFAQYQQSYFAVYGKLLKIMREKAERAVKQLAGEV